jgi:urease accessory protein
LRQSGAIRARFPSCGTEAGIEAILLNTAGGLTGGDALEISASLNEVAEATLTTAAAEKIYRAADGQTAIAIHLALAKRSRLAWLPQPTILFDRSRLSRRTDVEMAKDARLLALEILIFGRAAMGEEVRSGAVCDSWRVRRDGVLVFADTFRADGPISEMLGRPAILDGARALATLLYLAPDAGQRLDEARALLVEAQGIAAASSFDGILVVRATARDGRTAMGDLANLVELLAGRPLPRVWAC